jgi:hypothetical protein
VPTYSVIGQATANASANTEDTFIEITAPSTTHLAVKKIIYGILVGTGTTSADGYARMRVVRKSVAGSGGVNGSIVKLRPARAPASAMTVKVKTGSTNFSVGTVTDEIMKIAFHRAYVHIWVASDEMDYIRIAPSEIFGILIQSANTATAQLGAQVQWEEGENT